MAKLTELDAVNRCLMQLGQSPVNSLTAPVSPQVAMAILTVEESRKHILGLGWTFNTAVKLPLPPDIATKHIALSSDVLHVDVNTESHPRLDVVEKRNKLFNVETNSYEFDEILYCDVIEDIQLEELPEVARIAIAARAARLYADRVDADQVVSSMAQRAELESMDALMAFEVRAMDESILHSRATAPALRRRGRRY